mmetsp:Transcript_20719/g.59003  ORF Transcript_20719/g.59003 Transcript_20719/m.59003 type:complete len:241 (-) Transcript_20719:175-897(-)
MPCRLADAARRAKWGIVTWGQGRLEAGSWDSTVDSSLRLCTWLSTDTAMVSRAMRPSRQWISKASRMLAEWSRNWSSNCSTRLCWLEVYMTALRLPVAMSRAPKTTMRSQPTCLDSLWASIPVVWSEAPDVVELLLLLAPLFWLPLPCCVSPATEAPSSMLSSSWPWPSLSAAPSWLWAAVPWRARCCCCCWSLSAMPPLASITALRLCLRAISGCWLGSGSSLSPPSMMSLGWYSDRSR